MPAGAAEDPPRVQSWITAKAVKGGANGIEGMGVHAVEAIAGGEVVAVKGGHIVDAAAVAGLPEAIRDSAFQIAELTLDYAMFLTGPGFAVECHPGHPVAQEKGTGHD